MATVSSTWTLYGNLSCTASVSMISSGSRNSACSEYIGGAWASASVTYKNTGTKDATIPAGSFDVVITSDGSQVICQGSNSTTKIVSAGNSVSDAFTLTNVNDYYSAIGTTSRTCYLTCSGASSKAATITLSGYSAGGGDVSMSYIIASSGSTSSATVSCYGASFGCNSSGTFYATLGGTSKSTSISSSYGSVSYSGLTPNTTYSASGYVYSGGKSSSTDTDSVRTLPVAPKSISATANGDSVIFTVSPNTSNGSASCSIQIRYKTASGSWTDWTTIGTGSPNNTYTYTANVGYDQTGSVEARYVGSGNSSTTSASWASGHEEETDHAKLYIPVERKSELTRRAYVAVNGKSEELLKLYASVDGKSKIIHIKKGD